MHWVLGKWKKSTTWIKWGKSLEKYFEKETKNFEKMLQNYDQQFEAAISQREEQSSLNTSVAPSIPSLRATSNGRI